MLPTGPCYLVNQIFHKMHPCTHSLQLNNQFICKIHEYQQLISLPAILSGAARSVVKFNSNPLRWVITIGEISCQGVLVMPQCREGPCPHTWQGKQPVTQTATEGAFCSPGHLDLQALSKGGAAFAKQVREELLFSARRTPHPPPQGRNPPSRPPFRSRP